MQSYREKKERVNFKIEPTAKAKTPVPIPVVKEPVKELPKEPVKEATPEITNSNSNKVVNNIPTSLTNPIGKYINWNSQHAALAAQSWCCIGDLIQFCDKYEYKTLSLTDSKAHSCIIAEVKALLAGGQAPFDLRKRFPSNIRNPENLWVCIGRCASVEYHLNRILNVFRKPLEKLTTDKQRAARQNFHVAVNELRLDISARITEVRLYDCTVFEREFQLQWLDTLE